MSPEVKAIVEYRLRRARETAEEARILFASGKHSGALNRLYYSMFYAAQALLASRQMTASKHSGVLSLFHREFVKTGLLSADVAKSLDIAFDLRNKWDYRDFVEPDAERVAELLKDSEAFLSAIADLLK